MQQFYSQRPEMQIPQENTYKRLEIMRNLDAEFKTLSKNYLINKKNELIKYIKKHDELIPYLKTITPLINNYFPNNKKYLTFCKDPEFKELNQAMICVIGQDSLFEEERELMKSLNNDILYLNEFPINVKNLISVRLWWI